MAQELSGTFSADGNSSSAALVGNFGNVTASGTFGSGTVTLQVSYNNGTTWVGCGTNAQLTAAGSFNYQLPAGALVRLNLAGSTSPSISYWVVS